MASDTNILFQENNSGRCGFYRVLIYFWKRIRLYTPILVYILVKTETDQPLHQLFIFASIVK